MVEPGSRWLTAALAVQSRAASAITAGVCLAALAGLHAGLAVQLTILLGGIILIGFPHGAFDHLIARPFLSARLGRFWWTFFLVGYLGLAGLVWLAWVVTPALLLGAFLAATVLHFGLDDAGDGVTRGRLARWIAPVTHGSLPVLLAVAFHPGDAAPVLAEMGQVAPAAMHRFLAGAAWLLPPWAAAFVWVQAVSWRQDRALVRRLITVAGFVLLPPLLAFGLYFCLDHSARHLLRVMAWHNAGDLRAAARWAARVIAPASLVCAFGLAGLAVLASGSHVEVLAQTFRIIAALTFPHMLVTTWLDRPAARGAPPGARAL